MTEIEVPKNIRKTVKKSSMTPDEALAVIKAYDTAIKEAADRAGMSFAMYDHASQAQLKSIQGRNANFVGYGGIGIGVTSFVTILASMPPGNTGIFGIVGSALTAVMGCVIAVNLEDGKFSLLQRALSLGKYRKAKNAVQVDAKLHELKVENFKALEEKMISKIEPALNVVNSGLNASNKYMAYESLTELGSGGFVLKSFAYPKKDQWDEISIELTNSDLRMKGKEAKKVLETT
jgi:hypothetical protein